MATVSRRTWTTKRGAKGSAWVVSYYDHRGRQHRPQFKTKRQADDERVRVEGELANGTHIADRDSVSVLLAAHAFLADFEALVATGRRERSTLRGYRQHVALHLSPFPIAATKLSRLSGPACLAYARDLEASRSPAMAGRALSTLRAILDFAVSHGWCAGNPATGVRIRAATRRAPRDQDTFSGVPPKDDIRRLLAAADRRRDKGKAAALVRLLIFCGLRASELRALRRQDVDWNRSRLQVRQRADRWQRIGPCKSKAGRRSIPLPPQTSNALRHWILAAPVGDLDLVFPTGVGTVESYANIYNRVWVPLMMDAGLAVPDVAGGKALRPRFALHALRHVACSLWIEQGANIKQVQTWAGHASVQFTLDRYGHLWEEADLAPGVGSSAERAVAPDS